MKQFFKSEATASLLSTILILVLLSSSCIFAQAPAYTVVIIEESNEYHIQYDWSYGGERWRYQAYIPLSIYDHFTEQERTLDYVEYVYNEADDDWLGYTADSFRAIINTNDLQEIDAVSFVMSFVQNLPYAKDADTTNSSEYARYPMETMIDCGIKGGVDCEDTVILLVSILQELGYEVALLKFPSDQHMAAGVSISQNIISNWDEGYELTYYDQDGRFWVYCETTAAGWPMGHKDPKIAGSVSVEVLTEPN